MIRGWLESGGDRISHAFVVVAAAGAAVERIQCECPRVTAANDDLQPRPGRYADVLFDNKDWWLVAVRGYFVFFFKREREREREGEIFRWSAAFVSESH